MSWRLEVAQTLKMCIVNSTVFCQGVRPVLDYIIIICVYVKVSIFYPGMHPIMEMEFANSQDHENRYIS